jgi:ABC-type dipeptide/oligopeptide/nickel transport system ATPase component
MREKNKKLFVAILGKGDSGKSITWEALFRVKHRTGRRILHLSKYIQTEVYLFNSSPQERPWTKDEFIHEFKKRCIDDEANIVLCSLQSHLTPHMRDKNIIDAKEVLEIARKNRYDIFIQWLNPGFKSGVDTTKDVEKKIIDLMSINSVIGATKEDAGNKPEIRAEKLRSVILGWINSI